MSTDARMPAVFIGHGSPMNALEQNRFSEAWRNFADTLPAKPRAILSISAHWYTNATATTAMARPRTIHDFYGFPQQLFDVEYPVPGDAELAQQVQELLAPTWCGLDLDSWGIDHGTWSVLVHMFPEADVPVVQLAIDAGKSLEDHVELGRRLAPLRDEGVLVLGSGNVVHNLPQIQWDRPEGGLDWAERFEATSKALLTSHPGDAASLAADPDFRRSVPTPDHFIPVLYIAGLAHAANAPLEAFTQGCVMGSLSMTSYALTA